MSRETDREIQRTGRRAGMSLNRREVDDTLRVLRSWTTANPGRPLPAGAARLRGKLKRMQIRMRQRAAK